MFKFKSIYIDIVDELTGLLYLLIYSSFYLWDILFNNTYTIILVLHILKIFFQFVLDRLLKLTYIRTLSLSWILRM